MSGLAGVLAGHHTPGVYRWHGAFHVDDVRHAVEHAGWKFGYVDGWHGDSKAEFLDMVAQALGFPEHFGRNFDALADCLSDVPEAVLLWDGWGPFARADEKAFKVALEVLRERAADDRRGRFAVLLRGDGPDLPEAPSID